MTDEQSHGLRERKRVETKQTIERAALTLAIDKGYENVTIDDICEAAKVSQRTFFNYFGTREGVYVGHDKRTLTEDEQAAFVAGDGNIVSDLIEVISTAVVGHQPDPSILMMRRTLAQRSPELATAMLSKMSESEESLVAVILERYAREERTESASALEDEARMVVALSTGVMHYVMRRWFEGKFVKTPHDILREALPLLKRVTA